MAADAHTADRKLSATTEAGAASLIRVSTGHLAAAAVLAIGAAAGCSSGTDSVDPGPDRLPAGTAQITINGKGTGGTETVNCLPNKHLTTITIGDESPVAVAMVSNIDGLAVKWVRFHDANGFSGSYNDGLGGDAHVTLAGSTYRISGTAPGFSDENPSRGVTDPFVIMASC